ncbi:M24 family metallopeptidase [Thermofilum pendens]|uniref:M24 family metallopeptidase n=1 Tax=Thermofilum pendens TaxID=2269 RepID=UPI00069C68E5|nr:aminopeptidase P family protein [Thermofilum pendens]
MSKVVERILVPNDLNYLVVMSASNIFYLSGSDAPSALVVSKEGEVSALASRLEYFRAVSETSGLRVVAFAREGEDVSEYEEVVRGDFYEALSRMVSGSERIGVVGASCEAKEKLAEKTGKQLYDYSKEFSLIRRVKDPGELEAINRAARLAELAMRKALDTLEPGVTESEVASEILKVIVSSGAYPSFPPIVAFGEHAAHPHAKPSLRRLIKGDFVKIDLGAKVDGYCSDMTRTLVFGEPSEKQRRIFEAVVKAQESALASIKAGVQAREVHAIALRALKEAGLSQYFNHGLGHGVGVDIHEEPYLNLQSEAVLLEGDVVTVEPGVYLPGYGGVRIEDMVYVERGGGRLLTFFSKDMVV